MTRLIVLIVLLWGLAPIVYGQRYLEMIQDHRYTVPEIQKEAEAYFEGKDRGRGSGYKQYKRWEFKALIYMDEDGMLPTPQEVFARSLEYQRVLNQELFSRDQSCTGDWQELGPSAYVVRDGYGPGVGRVTSISIDPNDPDHIIVGAQTGGVWKTIDGGEHWTPLTDMLPDLEVYSLEIDPQDRDTYYWGGSGGLVLRSTDGGLTWEDLSIFDAFSGRIVQIRVHPGSGDVWAASSGWGVARYNESINDWDQKITLPGYDIEFHPTDDNVIYASGVGVFVSSDGGDSFIESFEFGFTRGITMMSVSDQAPDHLYVAASNGGGFGGLYQSRDRGSSFEILQDGSLNYFGYSTTGSGGLAPRDMDIVVSNLDTNLIFLAGIDVYRSLDGGDNFDKASDWVYDLRTVAYCHADIDIMVWNGDALYIGSDGGFYVMDDPDGPLSLTAIRDLSFGLGIHQFYRIGVSQTEPAMVSGGAQDNGSSIYRDGVWYNWHGGDGMESFFHEKEDSTILFGTTQNGGLAVSYDLGESSTLPFAMGLAGIVGFGRWISPFDNDFQNENIYLGIGAIYRSSDDGFSFTQISQDLGVIEFAIAPTGSDTIYCIAADSRIYRTFDGGETIFWESPSEVQSSDAAIEVHPKDALTVAATGSGGDDDVILSRDGGETWESYGHGLPFFGSVRALAWDDDEEETLYAAMTQGVFKRGKSDTEWLPFSFGLPNVLLNDIQINHETDEIFVGSYGRGAWVSPICDPSSHTDRPILNANPSIQSTLLQAGDMINMKLDQPLNNVNVLVYRVDGQSIYLDPAVDIHDRYQISTDGWSTGLYIIRLESSSGYKVFKVVVQ